MVIYSYPRSALICSDNLVHLAHVMDLYADARHRVPDLEKALRLRQDMITSLVSKS